MKNNLLLLHGALGSEKQFSILKKLLGPHFKIHTLNFSGHGGQNCEQEFSMELFVEDVLRFMKTNSIDKTDIFGYSMGGYVALNLALDFPEKVGRIMTLGTKINWTPETAKQETRLLDPEKMEAKIPKFVEALQKNHYPND